MCASSEAYTGTFLKVNKKGADRLASSNSYALEDYFNAEGVLTASAA